MTRVQTQQAYKQEDRADHNVETVEAGRHEEGRAIDVARETKRRVAVFISLEAGEDQAQQNCDDQTVFHVFAVVFMRQRVVRPRRRTTGAQQDQSVDQRQVPRIKRLDANRRPRAVHGWAIATWVHWVHAVLEEGPEPSGKEHNFGHDEQDKAVTQADLHYRSVVAHIAFRNNVGPPAKHDVQDRHQANQEHPRALQRHHTPKHGHGSGHPHNRAKQHDETTNGTQERPP
mmetsp:Transcript_22350/g.28685  ORF Transcript_22350/g.28685 Transcript_22350/m.28685 type:complete len:230 (+) Transcript_22350:155-844(+)